ncbi:hypothetical protein [Fibrobacter sp. UWEL]|uniref:hypothetical protein n=1 Tax=Fibrobacter sp. UWEL TaxID=1896209 RepID=UPI0009236331|nr:hypothetical protein [Fibrobacter sp. UWEL]SHK95218.1 hypothetical protein SAMN05720468_11041 [Fibrobacter sp. UWEL]
MADYGSLFPSTSSPVPSDVTYVSGFRPSQGVGRLSPSCSLARYLPVPEKPVFDQYLQSIQEMEKLPVVYSWEKDWQRKKGLELFKVLRDYGGYDGLSWMLTSGAANRLLNYNIRLKHSSYPSSFSRGGKFENMQLPGTSIVLDVPHFNAAISKYLDDANDDAIIPSEWASWAGDMFTYARRLQYIQDIAKIPMDSVRAIANKYIGGDDDSLSQSFGSKDFYADVDARNVAHLIKRGRSPYEAMNDYYRNQKFGRFNLFVHSYGSWKNFVDKVNSHFFFPITPTVNPIFVDVAKKAFIQRIQRELFHELGMD